MKSKIWIVGLAMVPVMIPSLAQADDAVRKALCEDAFKANRDEAAQLEESMTRAQALQADRYGRYDGVFARLEGLVVKSGFKDEFIKFRDAALEDPELIFLANNALEKKRDALIPELVKFMELAISVGDASWQVTPLEFPYARTDWHYSASRIVNEGDRRSPESISNMVRSASSVLLTLTTRRGEEVYFRVVPDATPMVQVYSPNAGYDAHRIASLRDYRSLPKLCHKYFEQSAPVVPAPNQGGAPVPSDTQQSNRGNGSSSRLGEGILGEMILGGDTAPVTSPTGGAGGAGGN